jgi:hypothetical protein
MAGTWLNSALGDKETPSFNLKTGQLSQNFVMIIIIDNMVKTIIDDVVLETVLHCSVMVLD